MAIIETTLGDMDETLLDKTVATFENDNERTTWVEYRLHGIAPPRIENGVCLDCAYDQANGLTTENKTCRHIHRSVHIALKKGLLVTSDAGSFG